MNGTSIVSLIAPANEENMFALDFSSNDQLPIADFLPPPMPAPLKSEPNFFKQTEIANDLFMTDLPWPQPQTPPRMFRKHEEMPEFDVIPFHPLPRSTAAELSWYRSEVEDMQNFPKYPGDVNTIPNSLQQSAHASLYYDEEDSDQSIQTTSSSHSATEEEEEDMFVVKEAYTSNEYDFVERLNPKAGGRINLIAPEILEEGSPQTLPMDDFSLFREEAPIIPTGAVKREVERSLPLPPQPPKAKRVKLKREVPPQNLNGYTKVTHRHTPGKKPKLKARWTLMCGHCGKIFSARPTPKNSRYVVNHICPLHENKRKQFVIGTKARKCAHEHIGPCIQQLLPINVPLKSPLSDN